MVAIVAVYDVWVISVGGNHASISQTMMEWSYNYPLFPFIVGVVIGHLFWRMKDGKGTHKLRGR